MDELTKRVEEVLEKEVRPQLALHRGDVELLKIENNVVYVRLLGQCSNCPASYLTTEEIIYSAISEEIPEIEKVVADQSVSEDLLAQARSILSGGRKKF